eukprot:TRINITY_DN6790_c0_g3_i2.p1 TRINITY_DN6790_c0_g3~~TRINITY_DN6790_c0_g3_i2.p1  ORF type:complete len:326 (-),score=16.31 TRINITY_DN6790_c0_g3_i2:47-1024(-)
MILVKRFGMGQPEFGMGQFPVAIGFATIMAMAPKKTATAGASQGDESRGLAKAESLWFAPSPSKAWCEKFFLAYSPVWITWALCIIVPFQLFEVFTEVEYMIVGVAAALPLFVLPFFIVGKADAARPWYDRFWAKANMWIFIFSFVGNYFWTHYFFVLLGARYTFPSWRLNNVPIPLYLLTHAYFCFYHAISNVTIRRLRHATAPVPTRFLRWVIQAAFVFALSYITAFMETATIAQFPYYNFVDKAAMYRVGSLFYAIYFFVSFPLFIRMEEKPNEQWDIWRAAVDSLGAAMLVTILLDFWRISYGAIIDMPPDWVQCQGLPWL